ncbi:MAG TPA: SPASM domain-containing protein, partial [Clostridia bacterium]|nr:SPASM domain-containing protein [Clostridia bacterium]
AYSKYCDYIAFCPVFNLGGLMPEIYTQIMPHGTKIPAKRECHNIFDAIGITCEGYLTACGCADFQNYLIVADLNKTSLYEGWYGEKFTELRSRYLEDCLQGLQCYNCVYAKTEPFVPLSEEYASIIPMEEVFTDKHLKERLKNVENYGK